MAVPSPPRALTGPYARYLFFKGATYFTYLLPILDNSFLIVFKFILIVFLLGISI